MSYTNHLLYCSFPFTHSCSHYYYFWLYFQGFQTILAILELSVSFSELLVHYSFDSVIFHQLSSGIVEQKDRKVWRFTQRLKLIHLAGSNWHLYSLQFLSLCCKCFAKLAVDDELKSVMLRRACDQNNSTMVECLLLLGADANQAKETTPLICQVKIQGLIFVFSLLFGLFIVQLSPSFSPSYFLRYSSCII